MDQEKKIVRVACPMHNAQLCLNSVLCCIILAESSRCPNRTSGEKKPDMKRKSEKFVYGALLLFTQTARELHTSHNFVIYLFSFCTISNHINAITVNSYKSLISLLQF